MDGGQEVVGETVCRDALVHVVGAEEADRVARDVEEAAGDEDRRVPPHAHQRGQRRAAARPSAAASAAAPAAAALGRSQQLLLFTVLLLVPLGHAGRSRLSPLASQPCFTAAPAAVAWRGGVCMAFGGRHLARSRSRQTEAGR